MSHAFPTMNESYAGLRDSLCDMGFTIAAPFTETGEGLATDALVNNLEFVYDRGGRLFIPNGNTGEYYSLTQEERVEIVRTTVGTLPDDATVVAGAGGSTQEVQELVNSYEELGVDAVMIMNPSHTYIHEQGLLRYYEEIIESTDLGVVIYKRGPEITLSVLDELAQFENVVGVKYAMNDVSDFGKTVEEIGGEVVWINGLAERYAPAFALEGAAGHTTGIGNFAPRPCIELVKALDANNYDRAEQIAERFRPFEELRQGTGEKNDLPTANNVPAVKYGLDEIDQYGGPVREPLVPLSDRDKEQADICIEELRSVLEMSEA